MPRLFFPTVCMSLDVSFFTAFYSLVRPHTCHKSLPSFVCPTTDDDSLIELKRLHHNDCINLPIE